MTNKAQRLVCVLCDSNTLVKTPQPSSYYCLNCGVAYRLDVAPTHVTTYYDFSQTHLAPLDLASVENVVLEVLLNPAKHHRSDHDAAKETTNSPG